MPYNVDQYLKILNTNLAPTTDSEIEQYVTNLLEGLVLDINGRMRATPRDKELADRISKEIKLRL